jgi:hypothetical protein
MRCPIYSRHPATGRPRRSLPARRSFPRQAPGRDVGKPRQCPWSQVGIVQGREYGSLSAVHNERQVAISRVSRAPPDVVRRSAGTTGAGPPIGAARRHKHLISRTLVADQNLGSKWACRGPREGRSGVRISRGPRVWIARSGSTARSAGGAHLVRDREDVFVRSAHGHAPTDDVVVAPFSHKKSIGEPSWEIYYRQLPAICR